MALSASDFGGWHNSMVPEDVNFDGHVTPLDVLLVVNDLHRFGERILEEDVRTDHMIDVNADDRATHEDARQIVRHLNFQSNPVDAAHDALIVTDDTRAFPPQTLIAMAQKAPLSDQKTVGAEAVEASIVSLFLETRDLDGNLVDQVAVGDRFELRLLVQDIRPVQAEGVFAVYADVEFDGSLTTVDGLQHSNTFSRVVFADLSQSGLIDDAGGAGLDGGGNEQLLVWTANMEARAEGNVRFATSPAGLLGHDVLLFGRLEPVPVDQIRYGETTISIRNGSGPQAVEDEFAVDVGSTLVKTAEEGVLANDQPGEAGPLSAILVSTTANGELSLSPDGSFRYSPDPSFEGVDSFTYQARDTNEVPSLPVAVSITVSGNAVPKASDDNYQVTRNTPLSIPATEGVLANDSDDDQDSLSAVLVTQAADGQVTLSPDGAFTYVPDAGFAGIDGFTYSVSDGKASANANVQISVAAKLGRLSGSVYWDINNDGLRAGTEPGIAGVAIELSDQSGVVRRTLTDSIGHYQFLNIGPGVYQIREIQPRYIDGKDAIGSQGGMVENDRLFQIDMTIPVDGRDNNFGELISKRMLLASYTHRGPS